MCYVQHIQVGSVVLINGAVLVHELDEKLVPDRGTKGNPDFLKTMEAIKQFQLFSKIQLLKCNGQGKKRWPDYGVTKTKFIIISVAM